MLHGIGADGYRIYDYDPGTALWAQAAFGVAREIVSRNACGGPKSLRHGQTWFVGVDALPNQPDGCIAGVPLMGPWQGHVPLLPLHRAQLSIIYHGYPRQDPNESDANHRFRRDRAAAHVDGVLPVGPQRRRFAREYHAYILSVPLTNVAASPTVVWRGSQRVMQSALRKAIADKPAAEVDITEAYNEARKQVFEDCEQVPLILRRGQSALLHPFILHGTEKWGTGTDDPSGEGRMIAFFRPECAGGAAQWLATP